jgi:hypothetical protein
MTLRNLVFIWWVIGQFFWNGAVRAQFSDDFSDGNFSSNPEWIGDTANFQINGNNQLQLMAPAVTGVSQLATSSQAIGNSVFDFYVQLDFDPSSSNYARVYVVASDSNLSNSQNGYFVQIGGATGNVDEVSLFYQSGTVTTKIIDGTDGTVAVSPALNVRVTRDMVGNWELLIDTGLAANYVSEGMVFHTQTTSSNFFGIQCVYTSTRSDKFFFDDFMVTGGPVVDITPPMVDSVAMITSTMMEVFFNEPVDETTSEQITAYSVNSGVGNPIMAVRNQSNPNVVLLEFANVLPNFTPLEITVVQVEDESGNMLVSQTVPFTTNYSVSFDAGAVLINEIFADPSPSQGMPEVEFIELFNATSSPIGLLDWTYSDAGASVQLPSYTLQANEFLIVCPVADTAMFSGFGKVLGISPWPTLNNSSDQLGLRDAFGNSIDSVNYEFSWYGDSEKSQGGFSLERINPNDRCGGAQNWTASNAANGATPGKANSVLDTNSLPFSLVSANATSLNRVEVFFSKAIDTSSVNISGFQITPTAEILSLEISTSDFSKMEVILNDSLERGVEYALTVSGMRDCEGSSLSDSSTHIFLPERQDILVNEILFNPKTGGSDFVELYNTSNVPIDLRNWSLMYFGTSGDSLFKPISDKSFVLYPSQFVVLSEDSINIRWNYPESVQSLFVEMDLPTYSNTSGTVILLDPLRSEMDYFEYNEDMHLELITDPKGVSLERTTYAKGENSANNWHSASSVAGYATPGYVNSQWINLANNSESLVVEPSTFSPNNDGYKDLVSIGYSFDHSDFIGTVTIHYSTGEWARTLVNNQSLGAEGTLFWDGTDANGEILSTGMYIVMMRVYTLENEAQIFKKVVVLAQP